MLKWLGLASDDTTTTGTGGVVGAPRVPAGSLRAPVRATVSAPAPARAPMKSMNALRPSVSPLGNRRVMSSSDIDEEVKPSSVSATLTGGSRRSRKNRKTKYRMPGRRTTRKAVRKNRKASRKSRRASRKNRK